MVYLSLPSVNLRPHLVLYPFFSFEFRNTPDKFQKKAKLHNLIRPIAENRAFKYQYRTNTVWAIFYAWYNMIHRVNLFGYENYKVY